MATSGELIVSGYIRESQAQLHLHIPSDIWMVFVMFYPGCIEFDGNTLNLSLKEKELITSWFIDIFELQNKSAILTSKLLYDFNKDGEDGDDFHLKCDGNINTFSIVETEFNGHIFGCFFSKKLELEKGKQHHWIDDDKVFLCVIRSCFKEKGPELFKTKSSSNSYFNALGWGPAFGPASLALLTPDNSCSQGKEIHGNVLFGGIEYIHEKRDEYTTFEIQQMNTFTINIDED